MVAGRTRPFSGWVATQKPSNYRGVQQRAGSGHRLDNAAHAVLGERAQLGDRLIGRAVEHPAVGVQLIRFTPGSRSPASGASRSAGGAGYPSASSTVPRA